MPTSFVDADQSLAARWGWFVALGVLMIVLGLVAWSDVVAVTFASTIVIGLMLIIGGLFQIFHAVMTRQWRGFLFGLVLGVLYVAAGLLLVREPIRGALTLTLFIAVMVIIGGVVRIVLALQHREMRAWGLVLLSGVISLVVGALIYGTLPWSGLWVLGTLIAIELIAQGVGWLFFGITLRSSTAALDSTRTPSRYGRA